MEGGVFDSEGLFDGNMDNSLLLLTQNLSAFRDENGDADVIVTPGFIINQENGFEFPIEYKNGFCGSFDYFKMNPLSTLNQSTTDDSKRVEVRKDGTNLPLSIVALMKRRQCPIDEGIIVKELKSKWGRFRKANGSRVIKATLKTSGLFYKTGNNQYYYKEGRLDKIIQSVIKRRDYNKTKCERNATNIELQQTQQTLQKDLSLLNAYHNYESKSAKSNHIPIQIKIKLNKVNAILRRMKSKYQCDTKYVGVLNFIKLFSALIDKYLVLIKKDKAHALFDFNALNEKIISICDTIDHVEKNKTSFPELTVIYPQIEHLCKINDIDMTKFDGDNNCFSEPPNDDKKNTEDREVEGG